MPFNSLTLLLASLSLFIQKAHATDLPFATKWIEKPVLALSQGEQRLLHISGLLKYSLGSPIVRILPLNKALQSFNSNQKESLLIKGITPGHGDLWVWKKDGRLEHRALRVEKIRSEGKPPLFERALSELSEVEVVMTGRGVILKGEVQSLIECVRIAGLIRDFPKEIYNETEITEKLLRQNEMRLQKWIKGSKYTRKLRVEQLGKNIWVRGSVEDTSQEKWITREILAIFPLTQIEISAFPDSSPTISFRVFLLELRKNQFHNLGLSWVNQGGNLFRITPSSIQNLAQMDLVLHQLEGSGNAKILSNPELVVRAPGEAELFAGGELPIETQNRFFSNITWKKHGLTLKLKVAHATEDRVRLDIFTEVSHLNRNSESDRIPGIQSNRMTTQVDAQFGIPLLLSGLLQQKTLEEARGLPFLRQIPILGSLFGSEDYLKERSELVAILLPYASPPPPQFQRFSPLLPRGPAPPPRNWIPPEDERALRESKDYPWNSLD